MKKEELLNKTEKKKLILRSSSERGNKKVLFIERNLLINFEGESCFRSQDYELNHHIIKEINSSKFANLKKVIIHHAKEVAMSWQTLQQLNQIDESLKNQLEAFPYIVLRTLRIG